MINFIRVFLGRFFKDLQLSQTYSFLSVNIVSISMLTCLDILRKVAIEVPSCLLILQNVMYFLSPFGYLHLRHLFPNILV